MGRRRPRRFRRRALDRRVDRILARSVPQWISSGYSGSSGSWRWRGVAFRSSDGRPEVESLTRSAAWHARVRGPSDGSQTRPTCRPPLFVSRGARTSAMSPLCARSLRDRRRLPMAIPRARAPRATRSWREPARACSGTTPSATAAIHPRSPRRCSAPRACTASSLRQSSTPRSRRSAVRAPAPTPTPLAPCSSGASAASPSSRSSRAPTSPPPRAARAAPPPPPPPGPVLTPCASA